MKLFDFGHKKPFEPRLELATEQFAGEGTVLVADVNRLDEISASLDPKAFVQRLNDHLSSQIPLIQAFSGQVMDYAGGCIVAYWVSKYSQGEHVSRALSAARKMLLNADKSIHYRILLSSGQVIIDTFGPSKQFQLLGEAIDIANQGANLCSLEMFIR